MFQFAFETKKQQQSYSELKPPVAGRGEGHVESVQLDFVKAVEFGGAQIW